MAQNIYDEPAFFMGYSQMRRSRHGLEGAYEWPSVRALVPDLRGKDVVDLGCGFGWFSRWARQAGAASVTGYDISRNMLERAREETGDPAIEYRCADLEAIELPPQSFDFAYSSLAFHYVRDVDRLVTAIRWALRTGGELLFTTEHPIYMAPAKPGWIERDGQRVWPVDQYLRQGERRTAWFVEGVVKYHRTIGTTLNALIKAGFTIRHVEEWRPSEAQMAAEPRLAEEMDRPMFLIVKVRS